MWILLPFPCVILLRPTVHSLCVILLRPTVHLPCVRSSLWVLGVQTRSHLIDPPELQIWVRSNLQYAHAMFIIYIQHDLVLGQVNFQPDLYCSMPRDACRTSWRRHLCLCTEIQVWPFGKKWNCSASSWVGLASTVYMYRMWLCIFCDLPAKNTVDTPYIYGSGQPYTQTLVTLWWLFVGCKANMWRRPTHTNPSHIMMTVCGL